MKPLTLVTGVTGRHGSTGYLTAQNLLQQGYPVRVMSRRDDAQVKDLISQGAEGVIADYFNYESVKSALHEVKQAYFCYPVAAGILEATANFCTVGRETGLRFVVNNSMGAAHPQSPSHLARCQWLSEQILDWAGFQCVHLRGGFFYENLLLLHRHSIAQENELLSSFGTSSISWVSSEDVAAVIAHLLQSEGSTSQSTLFVTSGEVLSYQEIANCLSTTLERKIVYRFVEHNEWREDLRPILGVNDAMIEHLISLTILLSSKPSLSASNVVLKLTGRKPRLLLDVIQAHRHAFEME
jgi:NAD(P)H dehydrogenase (quinone)